SLRYSPHQPLDLPISLQQSCLDKPCDPSSTCVNGQCVDAGTTCSGSSCNVADAGLACTPFGPIPIAAGLPAHSPRIAKTSSGYVVAYEPILGELHAVFVT